MLLDAGADISCRTSPSPALQAAATGGHREIAKLLLARGADVNEQRDRGLSALMAAARAGKLELVRELIAAGADVNASTEDGQTALLVASDVDVAIVDALLGAGADVNVQRSSDGMNALMVAALAEKTDIVKRLLDAGIDRARPNDFNETAAQLARTRGTPTGDAIAKLIEAK